MNPIKKIRRDKDLSISQFAQLLDSNYLTIKNVEKGDCLHTTYLTIIKKMSLQFDEIDENSLLKDYKEWKRNRQ